MEIDDHVFFAGERGNFLKKSPLSPAPLSPSKTFREWVLRTLWSINVDEAATSPETTLKRHPGEGRGPVFSVGYKDPGSRPPPGWRLVAGSSMLMVMQ
ncbi:MAG: hypothetical protein KKA60_13185 [Proteobacteria bacterium]|nr:hypothetical protein [Pseudomonadota bacterium]